MDVIDGTRNSAKLSELQRLVGDVAHIVPPPSSVHEINLNEH